MNTFSYTPLFLLKSSCNAAIVCIAVTFMCIVSPAAETNVHRAADTASSAVTPLKAAVSPSPAASTNKAAALLPKLVDLGAKKCISCKKLAPILEELKKDYAGALSVEFIDVWLKENTGQAEKYGIDTIPTQIFFDPQGKELWRHVGFISKEDILAQWKKLGYEFTHKKANTDSKKNIPPSK